MRVRAIQTGHYGILREPGGKHAVFNLKDEKHFSPNWMERVDEVKDSDGGTDDGSRAEAPDDEKPLAKRPIAELREMAEVRGLDHNGVQKAELADLIESYDTNPGAFA